MTGNVLAALNQPLVFFLLLVGTGCFLIAGELQTMVRESRRTARQVGATRKATSVGSPALGRRYRLTLFAASGLLLISAFGATSATFSQQLSGGMNVDVDFPAITPTPTPTSVSMSASTPTLTPAPKLLPAPTPTHTAAPTATPTDAPTATPTDAPTATPTDTPTP